MMRSLLMASAVALSALPLADAHAQTALPVQTITGTRLDVVATGEVTRVPDIAQVSTGVITTAPTATAALEQNAAQMRRVRDALRRAGIADRDIQTSAINLYPDYRQDERGGNPQLIGYRAQNEVTVRFRDIANTGKILDALVAEGANQINGPMLSIDKPEAALDEARVKALANARARAELYARAAGKRVGRILSISESGGGIPGPVYGRVANMRAESTKIDPGEQSLSVSLTVSFELE
ncbi:SIMPL domain-containing protein [Sphingomonas parva]|nr:SIMPL domain-containing protein [Sphingomonas parva]